MAATAERIEQVVVEEEIQSSFIDYAMSVTVSRALPDVRDGLKPVHKRILFAMMEGGVLPDRPRRKSAAAVGDVIRKYHPHGTDAVYDTMVRMAQDFSLRYPLIDPQGNFGSIDGDPPGAPRYTEARLAPLAMELLRDIDKETVDFVPNYDGYEQEPVVLPARFPNLLVNGSQGIAVGMATNIPPHNLGEVIDGVVAAIDNPDVTIRDLMKKIKAPDFPTAGLIIGRGGINEAYETGRGSIKMRGRVQIEEGHHGRARLVVTRRSRYELRKAEERDHIVQGLLIALQHIDEVIRIIRASSDSDEARTKLMSKFKLSEIQANYILDMPLRRLTRLERTKLEDEHKELLATIRRLKALLKDPRAIRGVVKDELLEIKRRYADARRTEVRADEGVLEVEDLIQETDVIITITRTGYVKRLPVETYRRQGRGGKGVIGANLKADDIISQVFTTTTHHWILVFTNRGKVYRTKVHEIPEASRTGRGTYVANLPGMGFGPDERIAAVIDIKEYDDGKFLVFATRKGMVKKTPLSEYDSPRTGLAAINLKQGDELIGTLLTGGKDDLILVSKLGQAIRFSEASARPTGRQTAGVIGMKLRSGDEVIALVATSQGDGLLTVTNNGYGKRTPFEEYPKKGRGGLGVKTAMLTSKVGVLAGAFPIRKDQDILVIANDGVVIRVPAVQVRKAGRATQGVRVMRMGKGRSVVAVAPVIMQVEE